MTAATTSALGRIAARPQARPGGTAYAPGLVRLKFSQPGQALLWGPPQISRPAPVAVLLHGAGGRGSQMLSIVGDLGERGLLVLCPDSHGRTWDMIQGGFGPDVRFIEECLSSLFKRCAIDPQRVAIGGFSDGASYALSLGLTNGDLFSHVLAFSPGFAASNETTGRPKIFISHGDRDAVLPVERCGRRLARELVRAGHEVEYREFSGGHVVPPEIVARALSRFLDES